MGLPIDPGDGGGTGEPRRVAELDGNRPEVPDSNGVLAQTNEIPLAARTHVWDPEYRGVGDANASSPAVPSGRGGRFVPLANAWTAAQDGARDALSAGRVPGEYRALVRRFFELE